MKKKILIVALFAMLLCLVLASCGQKAVNKLEIVTGLSNSYTLNETPDFSEVQAKVSYNDGTFTVVGADQLTFGELDTSTTGTKDLTITYGTFSITVKVSVTSGGNGGASGDGPAAVLESIAYFDGLENFYLVGDTVDTSKLRIIATYSNGQSAYVSAGSLDIQGTFDTATTGNKSVTVSYQGKTATVTVKVLSVTDISIISSSVVQKINKGVALDTAGLRANVTYSDESTATLTADQLTISGIDSSTVGKKTLTVSYKGVSDEIVIEVIGLDRITVDTTAFNYLVMKGGTFDFTSLVITAVYSDYSSKAVALADCTLSDVDTSTYGEKTLTITYEDKTANVTLLVDDLKGIEIVAGSINTTRPEGVEEDIDYSTIRLNAVYYYSSTVELTFDVEDLVVTQPVWTDAEKYFKVSYLGKEAQVKITETDPIIEAIDVTASNSKVYIGNTFNSSVLTVTAIYSDESRKVIELTDADLSIGAIDTASAGVKTLTVTYDEIFTDSVEITVVGVKSLTIDPSSITTTLLKGSTADFSAIKVTPTYTDDTTGAVIPYASLSLSTIDTAVIGVQELTATYYGVTAKINVTVKGVDTLIVSGNASTVVIGDAYSTDGITVTVKYTDGSSEIVTSASNLKFDIDTTVANDNAKLYVTYYGLYEQKTVEVTVKVLSITSIAIVADTLPTSVRLGDEFDTSKLVIVATLSDGTTKEYGIGANAIGAIVSGDLSVAGETNNVTVTFRGVSTTYGVKVLSADADYVVFGVDYDQNLGKFLAASGNKTQFRNQGYNYVVGNQNPFRFTLTIDALDDDLNPTIITSYESTSKVYLVENSGETLLTGDALAAYVSINESAGNNSFKFTDAAVGKTFRLETRPLHGVIAGTEANNTKSLTVEVVSAWNVYEAWELNIITNRNDEIGSAGSGVMQLDEVTTFLANNQVVRPANLAGIVIHKNLTIQPSDLPDAYFYTLTEDKPYQYEGKDGKWYDAVWKKGTKFFYDTFCVYNYQHTDEVPEFSIYGNYFTIYSYALPCVAPNGTANNENDLSSSQLFKFNTANSITSAGSFDHTKYTANVYSLFLRDDDGTDNDNSASMKHMLGLIGIKTAKCITNLENTNIYAYFISLFGDYDCLTVNVNECDLYNSWQNHIMTWANNNIDADDVTPHENHTSIVFNITDSRVAKSGGPVIITMTLDPEYAAQAVSRTEFNIDDKSTLFSYVTGQEAWFTAMGATGIVPTIISLNSFLTPEGGSFMTTLPGNGDTKFMNLVMLNMIHAEDASALLTGTKDVDGKLTIGGSTIMDMNDTAIIGVNGGVPVYGNYGDQTVAGFKAHSMLGAAPIFQSSNGSVAAGIQGDATGFDAIKGDGSTATGVSIGNGLVVPNGLYQYNPANAQLPIAPSGTDIYKGDYLTLYYNTFGLVFGYNEVVEEGSGY